MGDHWFRPKSHGYGATPVSWKGWLLTAAVPVGLTLVALPLIIWPALSGAVTLAQVAVWVVVNVVAMVAFIRLCRSKTDGEWRWRWGDD